MQAEKRALRNAAMAFRDALPQTGADALARALIGYLAAPPPIVAGYWPIGSEIDPRPALHLLRARGVLIALPETTPPGTGLLFRRWTPGEALLPGRFGTLHPGGPPVVPDLLLVPLLAFDRRGHRLGYGGGYYDRTLAELPQARAIGCAHAAQERDHLPTGPHDVPLDAIATECGVIQTGR